MTEKQRQRERERLPIQCKLNQMHFRSKKQQSTADEPIQIVHSIKYKVKVARAIQYITYRYIYLLRSSYNIIYMCTCLIYSYLISSAYNITALSQVLHTMHIYSHPFIQVYILCTTCKEPFTYIQIYLIYISQVHHVYFHFSTGRTIQSAISS